MICFKLPAFHGAIKRFVQFSKKSIKRIGHLIALNVYRVEKEISAIIHLISLSKFNLPLVGSFTWPMPPGPYRACRGRELNCGSDILFWPHKDVKGLPGWVISPMPGPPPRPHKHETQYTPSIHPFLPTRRIWKNDYGCQMIFGDLVGLKFPRHLSYRWGKTPKKPHPGNLSRPGIEPGPAAWQARMLPLVPRWTPLF